MAHGRGFSRVLAQSLARSASTAPTPVSNNPNVVDLGSGAGVPGLVVAAEIPALEVWLLDGSSTRAEWLNVAVDDLGVSDRVHVIGERAEVVGRNPRWRGSFDAVLARAFGRPAVTAECAAPLLRSGGVLIVSEPPSASRDEQAHRQAAEPANQRPSQHVNERAPRWPHEGLAELGLGPALTMEAGGYRYVRIDCLETCNERYPRRTGIPEKRPLF